MKNSKDSAQISISKGEQLLDMVHIDDVCRAYIIAAKLLMNDDDIVNKEYGVFTGEAIPLKEIIMNLSRVLNQKFNINIGSKPYKKREVMIPCKTLVKLPSWEHLISLEEGLKRFKS
jgi:CDP-3, 6-dideoxy-D-glycero-L-glycero-4-hexulose-4-reductase